MIKMPGLRKWVEAYVRAHPDEAMEHVGRRGRPETVAGLSLSDIDAAARGVLRGVSKDGTVRATLRNAEERDLLVDGIIRDLVIRVKNAMPMFESFGWRAAESDNEFGFKLVRAKLKPSPKRA